MADPTLALVMIVKNEASVISRCLESVKPIIQAWVIVDTGSTDGTQAVIKAAMHGIPGQLYERPWHNFGHNRSEALELGRTWADYSLMMDADDALEILPDYHPAQLQADAYYVPIFHGELRYNRMQIFANRLPWRYEGVLHEYPVCEAAQSRDTLHSLRYLFLGGGGRSQDPNKYLRDAQILKEALLKEPDNARYVFYLAQSYRDAGCLEDAITTYRQRTLMGGWDQEIYYSMLQIGLLVERHKPDPNLIVITYLRAYQYRPQRAESLYHAARYCRTRQEYALAYMFAKQGVSIARPDDSLFVDASVYQWKLLDELAIAAYWTGSRQEALTLNTQLLDLVEKGVVPSSQAQRIQDNLKFCQPA